MTTVKALGGGAQPASIDTSGKMTGGPALRVYGFDSEAAALAAGYVCEGGPAMSVALITDAQIASGAWRAEGDPAALAVYTAPAGMPIEGGFAVPVYPVNGWGSTPTPPPVPPLFSSAEVGTVNDVTVAVTFDQDIVAAGSDYSSGVTIKVNGSTRAFESGIRQANHAIVYYALSLAVVFGDVVTWEYVEASGNIIAEDDSTPLADVTAQTVTNNVAAIPPLFDSAEVGTVNASTVAVTFDQDVSASDYKAGVTIKVNGTATSITSATRQTNHAIVYYVIPVLWHGSGDVVTWEYAETSGNIVAEDDSAPLGDVTAQSVTNNCEYAALLDLQSDTLALSDSDPVSTWADQSGQGHDFTQTGTARPTKQTISTYPTVIFDGVEDWMQGGNFADNLSSASIILAISIISDSTQGVIVAKMNNYATGAGWAVMKEGNEFITQNDGGSEYYDLIVYTGLRDTPQIATYEIVNQNELHGYLDGVLNDYADLTAHVGIVVNIGNVEGVRLATFVNEAAAGYVGMNLYGLLICASRPSATNRAALEARLAARYGITL